MDSRAYRLAFWRNRIAWRISARASATRSIPNSRRNLASSLSHPMTSIGMTRCAWRSRSAPRFPPTRSLAWRRRCALPVPRPSRRKFSRACRHGRIGFSSVPTRSARRARSSFMAAGSGPSSIHAVSEEHLMSINYSELIPNNVNLADDRRLQRALEAWQPHYLEWWREMGPEGFQGFDAYLRTATSVDAKGWATFGYLKMPDYRWGIFLAAPEPDRRIGFGEHMGEPVWREVPGEHRGVLRRLIVTQGDTEPASVEQQRHLGATCPSLYDLRNLFQVNVEEGRHLWAMVYLLHKYFGRDGREEAEALLQRRSGDADKPRILGAFNERTPDWLSFFMFTFFTDRDGKMQLAALAQSGFDPLSRTCRFMLTEEAHHMFVGESGVQ